MKGLLISLLVLGLNLITASVIAHITRPQRYLKLFAGCTLAWSVGYWIIYTLTPPDLYFLSPPWRCDSQWLDAGYGFVVFILNCHTFVDCFFATCGGFSVSLLMVILNARGKPTTTADMMAAFRTESATETARLAPGIGPADDPPAPAEADRIYSWRVPNLRQRGYLQQDPQTGNYSLTPKGRAVALLTLGLKRMMNLGEGG